MSKEIGVEGLSLIKRFEGLYLVSYKCDAGVWTVGYGSTRDVHEGMIITEEQADKRLRFDVLTAGNCVNALPVIDLLNQNQFDALVSFVFNLGCGNFKRSNLRKRVIANPADRAIRKEFEKWIYAGGKKLNGLIKRRNEEADLYFTPVSGLSECLVCGRAT